MKKLLRQIVRLVTMVTLVPCLYLLSPFVIIKFGILYNQRIGHLAINTENVLRRMRDNPPAKRTIVIAGCFDPANVTLARMIARELTVVFSRPFVSYLYAVSGILKKTPFWEGFQWQYEDQCASTFALFNRTEPALSFTRDEHRRGRELLERMGIAGNEWFACCHAREQNYFDTWRPELAHHWEKVRFRNVAIDTFDMAAQRINENGGRAVRVGAFVDNGLQGSLKKDMIDYAADFRSDFGDVYLTANCRFFLCSNSGLNYVSLIFNRPIGITNAVPLNAFPFHTYDLFLPGLIVSMETGEPVDFKTLKEMELFKRELSALRYEEYLASLGLAHIPNTSDEIDGMCADFLDQEEGNPVPKDIVELQLAYTRKYFDFIDADSQIGRIGPRFLAKHRDLIFPDGA